MPRINLDSDNTINHDMLAEYEHVDEFLDYQLEYHEADGLQYDHIH